MAEKRLKLDARVVFLTHYIPLYQVRVLQEIASSVRDLHILLSTPIEPNRDFVPDWSGLDVRVQDTWTLRRRWRHRAGGFADSLYVHLPYDTSRQLRALKPDVVLSHELGVRSMGAARYCRRNPHAKLVLCTYMSERSEQNRGWMRSRLRRWLVQRADAITYNGPSCRAYLLSFGVPAERLFHLPYAADDRSIYLGPLDRDEGQTRHRLLVVGQLSERKGVLPMLGQIADYCRLRPQREIELVFAGDGPLRDRIRAFPLPGNLHVKLLGNVTPDDLAVWMLRCGALLAPTLADEWMLAVNEALHAGLPVLGSVHAQAVTSLIRAGVNGWPYDPLAPGALAGILDSYFAEPAYSLSRMRREARESVAERTPQWAARGALDSIQYVMGLGKQHDRQALSERDAR
jgi:hypothetical protein